MDVHSLASPVAEKLHDLVPPSDEGGGSAACRRPGGRDCRPVFAPTENLHVPVGRGLARAEIQSEPNFSNKKRKASSALLSVLFLVRSSEQIIRRNMVQRTQFQQMPDRQLVCAALIPRVHRLRCAEVCGDLCLGQVVVLAQIPHDFDVFHATTANYYSK